MRFATTLLLLTAITRVGAASPKDAPLASVLEPIRKSHGLPAMGALVTDGRATLAAGVVGTRVAGGQESVTLADAWHLGSDTKAMTATLVARLVERGVIDWGTTMEGALGELPGVRPEYRKVTVEELLAHQGGLVANLVAHAEIWGPLWKSKKPLPELRRWFAERVLTLAPEVPRGSFLYSNAGYMVVGAMLEAKTGKSWEELMREEIFTPLGMSGCGFGPPGTKQRVDQPRGHKKQGEFIPVEPGRPADNPPALGPAGTVHCPLEAWAKFIRDQLRGAQGQAGILTPASYARLHRPRAGNYGLGWCIGEGGWAKGRALNHAGSNTMWLAMVWVAPAIDRAYLVVTNAGDEKANAAVDEMVRALVVRDGGQP